MIFATIIILLLLGYAAWVFITIACMGGIRGYREYRRDCARIQKQLRATKENPREYSHITFNKIFG